MEVISAESEGSLSGHLGEMLADDASLWRNMKRDLAQHSRPSAAQRAADFILQQISPDTQTD